MKQTSLAVFSPSSNPLTPDHRVPTREPDDRHLISVQRWRRRGRRAPPLLFQPRKKKKNIDPEAVPEEYLEDHPT